MDEDVTIQKYSGMKLFAKIPGATEIYDLAYHDRTDSIIALTDIGSFLVNKDGKVTEIKCDD